MLIFLLHWHDDFRQALTDYHRLTDQGKKQIHKSKEIIEKERNQRAINPLKNREKDTKRIMSRHLNLPKAYQRDTDSLLRNQQPHQDDRKDAI